MSNRKFSNWERKWSKSDEHYDTPYTVAAWNAACGAVLEEIYKNDPLNMIPENASLAKKIRNWIVKDKNKKNYA
jgi:hypothetical protein